MLALTLLQKISVTAKRSRLHFGLGLLALLFLSPFSPSFSQDKNCDSLASFQKNLYKQYVDRIGAAAHLYNGAEYEGSYIGVLGNPLWNNSEFRKGSIRYDDVIYYDVPLAFDIVRNEILTKTPQPAIIRLETSKVHSFCIDQHRFVVIRDDTTSVDPLVDDIYELAFENRGIRLLVKRTKEIRHPLYAENKDSIVAFSRYFIQFGNRNYSVKSPGDLSKIFYDGKNGFRPLWKEKHLNFKKDPEAFIIQTLQFWIDQRK